jgi:hypothetical protein
MATVQQITAAKQGLYTMEAYGMVSSNVMGMAVAALGTIAQAEDVDAALAAKITELEFQLAATADWGYQNRITYALNTLKGLK